VALLVLRLLPVLLPPAAADAGPAAALNCRLPDERCPW
jgi:hypothetical protein